MRVTGQAAPADEVFPDFSAVAGTGLEGVIGALMTFVLVVAVLMLLVCAVLWALGASTGNHTGALRARTGVLVAAAAALIAGSGVAWTNFLLDIGGRL